MPTKQPKAFGQEIEENFNLTQLFASYVNKPEITALSPSFLVAGSQNVLIDYGQRVISRNGYKLYRQANTGKGGINSSYEWETSSQQQFSLRAWANPNTLEFDWNGTYNTLLSNIHSSQIGYASVLDYNEQQDVLLMVLGEQSMRRWSGGASLVRASTSTTVQKQGVIGPKTLGICTITNANPAVVTITAHGLAAGDRVRFWASGSSASLPTGITAGQTYYVISTGLDANDFEFSATLNGAAVATSSAGSGVFVVQKVNDASCIGFAFTAGDGISTAPTITDSNSNFLNAGFAAGDTITVVGSNSNDGVYTVGSVTAGTLTLIMQNVLTNESAGAAVTIYNQTGATWKAARFFSTISGRSIMYKGTAYSYTGGENTDTLVGLSAFPAVSLGDSVWQMADTIALPSDITSPFPNFYPNLIGVQLNMVFLGSTTHQMIFASKNNSYTNFALTSPRAAGDPVQQPLTSGYCTCIVPMDNDKAILNIQNVLLFGSGVDAWDQIDFHMSADNSAELLRILRYKTATGSGLISKDAICPIKNATIYISREPALDFLGEANLEALDGKKNTPISDPVKNDFDSYDFMNAHVKYFKRAIYIALPVEGIVLIYDMMRNLWQPPQTIPVSRFAVINDLLYGHSAITNETYQLFVGTDDLGVAIEQKAIFAYNNGGTRSRLKNMTEYWTEGYVTANAELDCTVGFGFNSSEGSASLTILGNDQDIVTQVNATPIGDPTGFGEQPFGGDVLDPTIGLPGAGIPLQYFYQIDSCSPKDYMQHFVEYSMVTLGGQFALVAHGSNQFDAGTASIRHKK
jgi:hypothetical protein